MSVSLAQLSFTGGEWTRSLDPRTDLDKYPTAVRTMRNFTPHPHGGCSNRPGLEFVVAAKKNDKSFRHIPFQFSVQQGYILEFGDGYVRFLKDGAQIVSPVTVSGAADNGSGLIRITTSTSHGFATGNTVTIAGVVGTTEANGTWIITVTASNTFDLTGSAFVHTYIGSGTATAIVELSTPYSDSDLPFLKYEQSADVLYLFHPSYDERKLTRTSHTAWTLTTTTIGSSIAAPAGLSGSGAGLTWVVTAVGDGSVESVPSSTASSAAGTTLSWSAVTGAVEYNIYQVVNGVYQWAGHAVGTSFAIPSTIILDDERGAPTSRNPFSGANNRPGSGAFWKQRLLRFRTNNKPQSIFGSRAGDFDNHNISSPLSDDDGFERPLNTKQVNEIRWGVELEDLFIGTSGGEFRGEADILTPTSLQVRRVSEWGVADILPLIIGKSLLFVDRSLKKIRDVFINQYDSWDQSDLSILAQHLFERRKIKDWGYQGGIESLVWVIMDDGIWVGLTYHREHQVFGFHRHDTMGQVETVGCLKNADGTNDVYFGVKRTINGSTKRYSERLHRRDFVDIEDAFFVDCGLTYDGSVAQTLTPDISAVTQAATDVLFTAGGGVFSPSDVGREIHYRYEVVDEDDHDEDRVFATAKARITTYVSATAVKATILLPWPSSDVIGSGAWRLSVTSLGDASHLEGMEVVALADGAVVDGLTVVAGSVSLPFPASKIHLGLPYTCDLETLGFDYPTRSGTMQDKKRSIPEVAVKLQNTRMCKIGPPGGNLEEIKFRELENLGEPTRLFTGTKKVQVDPGDPYSGRVFVRVDKPVPCTVAAIYPKVNNGQ